MSFLVSLLMLPVASYLGITILVAIVTKWLHNWWNPKCNGVLPPGSMGWPLLGETLQYLAPSCTHDVHPFVKDRMQRHGPIFKTSLVGQPLVVATDADLSYLIFEEEGRLFQSWYPDSFVKILGRQSIGSVHGFMFKHLKNMVLNLFGPESLKTMLPEVEQESRCNLRKWATQTSVDMKEATAQMIFKLTVKWLIGCNSESLCEKLRESFAAFIEGLISLPFNIPGTAYHKCLEGRKKVMMVLRNMLQERHKRLRNVQADFFDYVLEELQREGTILTEEIALDLIFGLLFASFETTSLALTLATKHLGDHASVLNALTQEHDTIIQRRENPDSWLTWNEFKSMKFTLQFINETLRLANVVPGIFRKAMKDVKFKGYTIPAGWGVMVCPPAVHLNPEKYKNPFEFNPWRWEGIDTNKASKNFMAFGGGMRLCIGSNFAKLQMAVFLHCLVTQYKWEAFKGGDII